MSNKKDRRRGGAAAGRTEASSRPKHGGQERDGRSDSKAGAMEIPAGLELFPPIRHSLAHGVAAITCSIWLIVAPLLVVPVAWLALRAFGLEIFPPAMVQILSIPPISSSFDLVVATNLFGAAGMTGIVFLLGVTVLRALVWGILVGLIDEALEYRSVSRLGVLRGLNAFWGVLMYCYISLGVMLVGNVVVGTLGPGIGSSVSILTLVAGLMFLTFAPAAKIRISMPAVESIQRSIRGARLPGWPKHMMLVVLYFFFAAFLLPVFNPGFATVTANPSAGSVVYVLVGTFLNMVFLAAFVDRWKVIEDYVPASQGARKR